MKKLIFGGMFLAILTFLTGTVLFSNPSVNLVQATREVRVQPTKVAEYKNVDFYGNCNGTYNVTIETNTNRNWRVNGEEKWIDNSSATWTYLSAPFTVEWYSNNHGWNEVNSQTDGYTFTRHPAECMTVCLDGKNELSIPKTREALKRVKYSYPEVVVGKCEEPEQPEEPTEPEDPGTPPTFASSSTEAPVCPDGNTVNVPANPHVLRAGEKATVNFFITEGDSADVVYKEVNASDWQHAVSNVKPNADKFVSVEIGGLDPLLGYTFGVRQKIGCGGGQTITAVIIDGPEPQLFQFSYWEVK